MSSSFTEVWDSANCTTGPNWTTPSGTLGTGVVTATTPATDNTDTSWSFSNSNFTNGYPQAGFAIKDQTENGSGDKVGFWAKEEVDGTGIGPRLSITFTAPWDSYNTNCGSVTKALNASPQ